MKGILIGSFILFICSLSAFAQNSFTITGIIVDKDTEQPVDAATVSLLNAKDSSFVSGDMSNPKGVFTLKAPSKGNYLVNITYIGYDPVYKPVATAEATTSNISLGRVALVPGDALLEEVVVTAKVAEMIAKNDTIEYNAESYKTPDNAVVEDLLKKLPGVEVDKDGKITVNGKEVKRFLVDGKEFFSDDPQVVSKNLPAEMIEKLQVLDKKSEMAQLTGFNDNEEETVINLTVKPGMKKGTMGNAMVGAGRDVNAQEDMRYEGAALLNHMRNNDRYTLMIGGNNTNNMGAGDLGAQQFGGGMRGMWRGAGGLLESQRATFNMNKEFSPKFSLNGDLMFNASDRNSISDVSQTTLAATKSQLDKTFTKNNDNSSNFFTNFRMEWKPDSSNTFIFRPGFGYNKSSSDQLQNSDRLDYNTNDTIFKTVSSSDAKGSGYNFRMNVDYAHRFSKPGRVFSVSARGSYNDSYSHENSDWVRENYQDAAYLGNTVRNQIIENDNNATNYRFFVSFVEPLPKNNFIQATYRISNFGTESLNSTYNLSNDPFLPAMPMDTAVLYGNESRSTVRNSLEQRYSVNFKSVRAKYNYTIGLNVDPTNSVNETYQPYQSQIIEKIIPYPFDNRMPNILGDSLISEIKQNVVNFSPEINFNYLFDKRTNLRFDYSGSTNQPSANELRDFTDESDPNNITRGNPNLKPGYENEFSARFSKSIPESQLFYNVNVDGDLSFNDITSVTVIREDGTRLTTYENVNGNWNVRMRAMVNTPFRNRKFSVGNFVFANLGSVKSFTNGLENTRKNASISERLNLNYRSQAFDLGINGSITYSDITYDINPENNQNTLNWGMGGYTTLYLPHHFTFESDINWTARSGYADGFNISETIWNASLSKQLFNGKIGTGTFKLKIYDILKDRNSISGTYTTNGFRSSMTNTIPSFFMCSFIYKFSAFPGGAASEKDFGGNRGGWGGPGGGGRPGGRPY